MSTLEPVSALYDSSLLIDHNTETEAQREQHFLKRLSLILAIAYFSCINLVLLIVIFTGFLIAWILLGIVVVGFFLALLSYRLSYRHKTTLLGSWIIIVSTLAIILVASFILGSKLPVSGYYLIPLSISMFLLRWKITLIFSMLSVTGIGALYLSELSGYQAPLSMDQNLNIYLSIGIWCVIILTPIGISSFMVSQLRCATKLVLGQTIQLNRALRQLEEKRHYSQVVGEQLNSMIVELNATASQQAGGSQQQAAALHQSISSLEELAQTAREIAQKADSINDLSQQILNLSQIVKTTTAEAAEAGELGRVAVERTNSSNRQVGNLYHNLVETLTDLEEGSNQIKGITATIRSISNETHLLSLNAAIEAAGAGEYGERFAVVAGEVKNLSNRSMVASTEIGQVLDRVEEGIRRAVEAAYAGQHETERAVDLASESGLSIRELAVAIKNIAGGFGKISEMVKIMSVLTEEINYATNQQFSASKQAAESLSGVGVVAQQTASSSRQLNLTAHDLENMSQGLKEALKA
jgi:methyl-accepting chemotaxis protein